MSHLGDLYRTALRLTGNAARVWVFTILRMIVLRRVERRTRSAEVEISDSPLLEASEVLLDTSEALRPIQETRLGEVREAVGRLPLAFREPLVLAHVGDFSHKEISEILAIRLGTVMSRLFRPGWFQSRLGFLVRPLRQERLVHLAVRHPPCALRSPRVGRAPRGRRRALLRVVTGRHAVWLVRRVRSPLRQGKAISARRRGTCCSTRRQIARGSRLAPPSPIQVWSFVTRLWAWPT